MPFRRNQRLTGVTRTSERTMGVAYALIGSILLLGGIGYLLDMALATSPMLLIAGLIVGLIIGFAGLGRLMKRPT